MAAKLIGLYAPVMGSGKSVVANALTGHGYVTRKFAGPLKDMLRTLLNVRGVRDLETQERMVEGDLKEFTTPYLDGSTPRHALQTLGTEWGRNCMGQDFWVNSAMGGVDAFMAKGVSVVMDDMRFPNEAQAIKERGGLLVQIIRPEKILTTQGTKHASEGSLRDCPFDLTIYNTAQSATEFALHACHEIGVAQWPDAAVRNQ